LFDLRVRLALRGGRSWPACFGRVGTPAVQAAKTILAAVLAFQVAHLLHTSTQPILAPLTALLAVQLTLYSTLASGLNRIVAVVSGVVLAVGVATLTGLTWWSLGATAAIGLVVGRVLRLGEFLLDVPTNAMVVLSAASTSFRPPGSSSLHATAMGRVVETLIGAAVGIGVNALIAPPIYIQPADDAIGALVGRLSGHAREIAGALRAGWSREQADRFLRDARLLRRDVDRADEQLARTEESARLNPRGRLARDAQPRLRTALTGLEHAYVSQRAMCRAILDRTFSVPEAGDAYTPEARAALADVLDAFAEAMDSVDPIATAAPSEADTRALARAQFVELHRRRDRLAALLRVDPSVDAAAWEQHGALLAVVDRLRVEVEAAVRPTERSAEPEPIGAWHYAVLRRRLRARRTPREPRV
jgi:hypothetical protein